MTDYIIGKSAKNNWEIFDEAKSFHTWFHLDSFSSPYVILNKEDITKDDIIECAQACKNNSKYKNIPNIKIVYCRIDNLKKGDTIGSVFIKSHRKCKYIIV